MTAVQTAPNCQCQELWPAGISSLMLPASGLVPVQLLLPDEAQPVMVTVLAARRPAILKPARIFFRSAVSILYLLSRYFETGMLSASL